MGAGAPQRAQGTSQSQSKFWKVFFFSFYKLFMEEETILFGEKINSKSE